MSPDTPAPTTIVSNGLAGCALDACTVVGCEVAVCIAPAAGVRGESVSMDLAYAGAARGTLNIMSSRPASPRRYSYLGPAGTFTEAALSQVEAAQGQEWNPVANIGEALGDVVSGFSDAAMIAIENSIDGGVTVAQDALATIPGLQIIGEYLVSVNFVLVVRPGTKLEDIRFVAAHQIGRAHV